MIVDTKEPLSEDLWAEMRVGNVLFRNSSPAIRCNTIRTDWENPEGNKVPDQEPYSTLSTYRTVKNFGMVLGMYYQMALLDNKELYEAILPDSMGYPSFESSLANNKMTKRSGDLMHYVQIKKTDVFKIRLIEERQWRRNI